MKRTAILTVLISLGTIAAFSTEAFGRRRYISPDTGRFTQRDPLGYVDGNNLYENRRSNPINRADWRGAASEKIAKAQPKPKLTPVAAAQKKLEPKLAAIRKKIAEGSGKRIKSMTDKLKTVCAKKAAIADAKKGQKTNCCTKTLCEEEAATIAVAYNAMWEKYAYNSKSYGMQPTNPDEPKMGSLFGMDLGVVHAGWMCMQWQRLTWEAVRDLKHGKKGEEKDMKCWKFGRAGAGVWKNLKDPNILKDEYWAGVVKARPNKDYRFESTHNWVTATVGSKAKPDGKSTLLLDPWYNGNPRKFIFTTEEHKGYTAAYFSSWGGDKGRGGPEGMFRRIAVNLPKHHADGIKKTPRDRLDGPPIDDEGNPYYWGWGADVWPGPTKTVGLKQDSKPK
ncbi:MAG: hypothetical protein HN350_11805 [Phycisphaerales bacterium]|jgi:hypothetical protein|nr:hypothetical protein [Phycisphaerales bacterium]